MKKFLVEWWNSTNSDAWHGILASIGIVALLVVVAGIWAAWVVPGVMITTVGLKALTAPIGMLLISATTFYLTEYEGDD